MNANRAKGTKDAKGLRSLRRRPDDGGQLMMLAGIVITISFILTSLTLAQVSSLEREAAAQGSSPIVTEWRFLHDRLRTNFQTAVSVETTISTFENTTFPTIVATFRNIEAEKGYDMVLRMAGGSNFTSREHQNLTSGASYNAWTDDGSYQFTQAKDDDDDGILWRTPCLDTSAPAYGCIQGVYVFVRLSDGAVTMEEHMLFVVNQG